MKNIHPLRLFLKTIFIFIVANLIFALWNPPIGRVSVYNKILPGRTRFPFDAVDNLDALFASHEISAPKEGNEFRVIIIGDSSIWGDGLESEQTSSAWLNKSQFECSGKDVKFYNLGFPHLAIMKDLLILEKAMEYQPDAIIWSFSLRTVLPKPPNPFLIANVEAIFNIIKKHKLKGYPYEEFDYEKETLFDKTFIGKRDELARILLLQTSSTVWLSTKSDVAPIFLSKNAPAQIEIKDLNDLEDKISYLDFDEPSNIIPSLWLDYFNAGEEMAGNIPVLFVNQPMFIASGENSDLRYNEAYPRWAYDQYRQFMFSETESKKRPYLDLWNAIDSNHFIGHTFHLSSEGEQLLAEFLGEGFQHTICGE